MNHRYSSGRPAYLTRIQHIIFGGEAEIVLGKWLRFGVVKGAFDDLRGTLAINSPGASSVDRFPVNLQPGADFTEHSLHLVRNRAVGTRTNIYQQVSVFADDVYKLMNDRLGRFEAVVLDIAPGFVADRGVGLPVQRADVVQLTALYIENG